MPGDNPTPADPDELLYRNVNPNWIDANGVQSCAFNPTKKDEGELSVDLASRITAECAFFLFTKAGYASAGIWSITLSECDDVNTNAFHDPRYAHPSHGFIDFRGKTSKECKRVSKILKHHANASGAAYKPKES